jgi:hypothetical protein
MLMCDHARRVKVTRKRANQPKTTATRRAAAAEAAQCPPFVVQTSASASAQPSKASQRPRSKPRAGQLLNAGPCLLPASTPQEEEAEAEAVSSSSCDEARGGAKKTRGKRFGGPNHRTPHSSQSQQRCHACAARLSFPSTFQCRCGKAYCARHRHPDLHTCPHPPKPPHRALPQTKAQQASD